jgi:hypothetical protein
MPQNVRGTGKALNRTLTNFDAMNMGKRQHGGGGGNLKVVKGTVKGFNDSILHNDPLLHSQTGFGKPKSKKKKK